MIWILVGVVLLGLILLLVRWYIDAEPKDALKVAKFLGVLFILVVVGLVIASGRIGMLWLIFLGLLPWISRFRALNRQAKNLRGPIAGQRVDRKTNFVVIYLNPETGDMDGRVLQGPQSGKLLSEISIDELVTLYEAALLEDAESASILEAYMDRMHGKSWRQKSLSMNAADTSDDTPELLEQGMSRSEAYKFLGLQPGASKNDIGNAFTKLTQTGHPDESIARDIKAKAKQAKSTLLDD